MITIASMDVEKKYEKSPEVMKIFWNLIDDAVEKYSNESECFDAGSCAFDPAFFVSDGQGSIWSSIRWHFGQRDGSELLENREQTCAFHFKQGCTRVLNHFKSNNLEDLGRQFVQDANDCINYESVDETVVAFEGFVLAMLSLPNTCCLIDCHVAV